MALTIRRLLLLRRIRTSCWRTPKAWSRVKPPAKSSPALPPAPSAGPVKPEEVERILRVTTRQKKRAKNTKSDFGFALCRVLVSPHFLFRVEIDPAGAKAGETYKISELELASRLVVFPLEHDAGRRVV